MTSPKRGGRRYPLLLYTRMLDRWWPALFLIGLGTLALAWPAYSNLYTRLMEPWRWMTLILVGSAVVLASLLMLALRKSAYVQAFPDHLRLVTPFLRMHISYRRIQRTMPVAMTALFPRRRLSGLKRDILEPLFGHTALVMDMNALPIPAPTLRLFLSPFFFKDQTAHIVILVKDWMAFSTELDTMRRSAFTTEEAARTPSSFISGYS